MEIVLINVTANFITAFLNYKLLLWSSLYKFLAALGNDPAGDKILEEIEVFPKVYVFKINSKNFDCFPMNI